MYKLIFKTGVINLPKEVLEAVGRADAKTLSVLLAVAAHPEKSADSLAGELGMSRNAFEKAVAFWQGAGILNEEEKNGAETEKRALSGASGSAPTVIRSSSSLPVYSSEEIAQILTDREDVSLVVKECQNIYQKAFSSYDINVIVALMTYLDLDGEYVLSLAASCALSSKSKGLRYLQTMAVQYYDEGIRTPQQLHETLRRREALKGVEGQIRVMFGIGTRSLTKKETEMITTWTEGYGYGIDMIRKAYEIGVNASGVASFPYTNAILKRWYEEGYRTPEEVDRQAAAKPAEAAPKPVASRGRNGRKVSQQLEGESSFELDDFLTAAIQRSSTSADLKDDNP